MVRNQRIITIPMTPLPFPRPLPKPHFQTRVGTILCASYWSAWNAREAVIEQEKMLKDASVDIAISVEYGASGFVDIITRSAFLFVVVASCFLIMLYKLMSLWFSDVLVVLFCIGGAELRYCVDSHILQIVRVPNLKVGSNLLDCVFFYDIFWVFASKWFFYVSVMIVESKDGCSHDSTNGPNSSVRSELSDFDYCSAGEEDGDDDIDPAMKEQIDRLDYNQAPEHQ
ncbi:Signal peptide peptidase-like 5 [Bienertia sinuspersici]